MLKHGSEEAEGGNRLASISPFEELADRFASDNKAGFEFHSGLNPE